MYGSLLKHHWLKLRRASYFREGWGVKVFMLFFILYFSALFFFLGMALPEILEEMFPASEKLSPHFFEFVLYYLSLDLLLRFFLQDLNLLTVQHYLSIAVKKSSIIHYVLQTSVFSFFNLLPLFIIIPFYFRLLVNEYSDTVAIAILMSLLFLVFTNHFLAIFLKRKWIVKRSLFLIFAALLISVFALDYFEIWSLRTGSRQLLLYITQFPLLSLVFPLLLLALYRVNFTFLRGQTYLDIWQKKTDSTGGLRQFKILESKGVAPRLLANEIKLILRHKRTRSALWLNGIGLLYGLFFYLDAESYSGWTIFVFAGVFMTGLFMMNYGQFLVAWESAGFDGVLTRNHSLKDFYQAKFLLLAFCSTLSYIFTIPYLYFGLEAFLINTACFIYNLGVNSFIVLYASTYQKKRIDLSKGSAFNYQGMSALQMLMSLPLLGLPLLTFQFFKLIDQSYLGLATLAGLGIISLALHPYWIRSIVGNLRDKKYKMSEGFRQSYN